MGLLMQGCLIVSQVAEGLMYICFSEFVWSCTKEFNFLYQLDIYLSIIFIQIYMFWI